MEEGKRGWGRGEEGKEDESSSCARVEGPGNAMAFGIGGATKASFWFRRERWREEGREGEKQRVGSNLTLHPKARLVIPRELDERGRRKERGKEGRKEEGSRPALTLQAGGLVEHARLNGSSQQVVGGRYGVDVPRQVEVELFHGHHLGVPTWGGREGGREAGEEGRH